MFAHEILNQTHKDIGKETEYYVVPFGHRCTSALACKYANLRKFSLPFDWTSPLFPDKIKQVLENEFNGFMPDVQNNQFVNQYNFGLAHFNKDIEKGIEEYKRRIQRFYCIMNERKTIYFVHINEDYLYDPYYRSDSLNNYNFAQMLEVEKVLQTKYTDLDYKILYFNFKKHVIPKDSKIINVVLISSQYYENEESAGANVQHFRDYCGKILSDIFQTKMQNNTWEYDVELYNN